MANNKKKKSGYKKYTSKKKKKGNYTKKNNSVKKSASSTTKKVTSTIVEKEENKKNTVVEKKESAKEKKPIEKVETVEENKTIEKKETTKEVKSVEKKKSSKTTGKKKTTNKTKKVRPIKKEKATNEVVEEVKIAESEEIKKETVEENSKSEEQATDTIELSDNKPKKKKKIKYIIHFMFLVIVIAILILFALKIKDKSSNDIVFDKIDIDTYLSLSNDSNEYIYLSSYDCFNCDSYEKNLKKLETEYKIIIKELNISDLTDDEINKIKASNSAINDEVEIPVLLSTRDNSGISGIKEYNALKRFMNYSKDDSKNSFTRVSIKEYLNLLKSKDKSLIYICESSDSTCENFSKTLESVVVKKGVTVYYLDTNEITTEENWDKLNKSNKIFEQNWTKPVIMVVKDNKILDYKMYSMNETDLTSFLKKNGL